MNTNRTTDVYGRSVAEELAKLVNSYSLNCTAVAKEMTREHRTLQQSFTRLCVAWLKECAKDTYSYDGRNEATHFVAKKLVAALDDDCGLPMI